MGASFISALKGRLMDIFRRARGKKAKMTQEGVEVFFQKGLGIRCNMRVKVPKNVNRSSMVVKGGDRVRKIFKDLFTARGL